MSSTEFKTSARYITFADGSTCSRWRIDDAGTLRAWDSVAGHYTTLFSRLTPSNHGKVIAEAKRCGWVEPAERITDNDIRQFRQEAAVAGDAEMVQTCDRALAGSKKARRIVAEFRAEWVAEN